MRLSIVIALYYSLLASALSNELHVAGRFFLAGEKIELVAGERHAASASSGFLSYVNEDGKQVLVGGARISIDLDSHVITVDGWSVISIDGKLASTPANYSKPATFKIFPDGKLTSTASPSVIIDKRAIDSRRKMLESLRIWMNKFLGTVPNYAFVGEHANRAEQGGARQPATAADSKSEGSEKPEPETEGRSQ